MQLVATSTNVLLCVVPYPNSQPQLFCRLTESPYLFDTPPPDPRYDYQLNSDSRPSITVNHTQVLCPNGTRVFCGHAAGRVSQWPLQLNRASGGPVRMQGVKTALRWQAEGYLSTGEAEALPSQHPSAVVSMRLLAGTFTLPGMCPA